MKLLLWDIDCTLLKVTSGIGANIFVQTFRKHFEVDTSDVVQRLSFSGRTDKSLVFEIAHRTGISHQAVVESWEHICDTMTVLAMEHITPNNVQLMPGAAQIIESASAMGFHQALVTGNVRAIGYHKLLCALPSAPFKVGAFGNEFLQREMLPPLAIERFNLLHGTNITHASTVVIGDAPADIVCAHANNIPCIAIATGEYSQRQLWEAGANHARESLLPVYELLSILSQVQFGSRL